MGVIVNLAPNAAATPSASPASGPPSGSAPAPPGAGPPGSAEQPGKRRTASFTGPPTRVVLLTNMVSGGWVGWVGALAFQSKSAWMHGLLLGVLSVLAAK